MKVLVLSIICFCLSIHSLFSQSQKIDSLKNELSRLERDTIKVNTLLELAKAFAMSSKFEEAKNNATAGLELSKAIAFPRGEMRSLWQCPT